MIKTNNFLFFFALSFFCIDAEIEIVLPNSFLENQEHFKDFQLTLFYISNDEEIFLNTLYKNFKQILKNKDKEIFQNILSEKNLLTVNKKLQCFENWSLQSLEENKTVKENTRTLITINQLITQANNKEFNLDIEIFNKNYLKKPLSLSINNLTESLFKKTFLV